MGRTALFSRQTPGGFNDYLSIARHPGDIWFVGSTVVGAADAEGWGYSPDAPFLTLVYALTRCTASQGDVIYLLPGHVETVVTAGLAINVAGIAIRGIGEGLLQPIVDLTEAIGTTVTVSGASVEFEGVFFRANFEDITVAITLAATDATFRKCRFEGVLADTHNAVIWIQDGAAATTDRITVEDCKFVDYDAANTHAINFAGTGTQHVFRRNRLIGSWSTYAIGGAGAIIAADISDNYVYNISAGADVGLSLAAATTGVCMNNRISTGQASASQITAAGLGKCQNYGGLIGDNNGLLEPPAT